MSIPSFTATTRQVAAVSRRTSLRLLGGAALTGAVAAPRPRSRKTPARRPSNAANGSGASVWPLPRSFASRRGTQTPARRSSVRAVNPSRAVTLARESNACSPSCLAQGGDETTRRLPGSGMWRRRR